MLDERNLFDLRAAYRTEHDLRKEARAAWQTVRHQFPQRTFTGEFRDGFLDGYVDYLDRTGAAQPPAVPPIKSHVCDKKYFTPEGQCLVRDYYLGFKYGADVAVASGHRQYRSVPVLLSNGACAPGEFPADSGTPVVPGFPAKPGKPNSDQPPPPRPMSDPVSPKPGAPCRGLDDLPPVPPGVAGPRPRWCPVPIPIRLILPLPKPELPVIKPFNPDLSGGRLAPLPPPAEPARLPVPNPPLPISGSQTEPLPLPPEEVKSSIPRILEPLPVRVPAFKIGLSTEPDELVPPTTASVPPILGVIPVIPFHLALPAPDANPLSSKK